MKNYLPSKEDAGPIERFLLATILTFIILPLIFLTLIIAPIAWVVSLSIEYFFPPTEEERQLAKTLTEVVSNLRNTKEIKGILKKSSKYQEIGPQNKDVKAISLLKLEKNPVIKKRGTFDKDSNGKSSINDFPNL